MKGVLFLLLFTFLYQTAEAKGWKGIIPLHSTRADVERMLGQPSGEGKSSYYLKDFNVFLVYSEGGCKDGKSGGWNVPPDTVIRFTVVPKIRPMLSALNLDEKKFKKKEDPEVEGIVYYTDVEEGLTIAVTSEIDEVRAFYYEPAAKDSHLRCP